LGTGASQLLRASGGAVALLSEKQVFYWHVLFDFSNVYCSLRKWHHNLNEYFHEVLLQVSAVGQKRKRLRNVGALGTRRRQAANRKTRVPLIVAKYAT
jgi:hypothetical protein